MEAKRKLAGVIVKYRIWILIAMLACAVFSAMSIGRTRINYDLTRYLSEDTMTRRALHVMEEEFGSSEQLRLVFEDKSGEWVEEQARLLGQLDEVKIAAYDPESGTREAEGKNWRLVTLTLNECDEAALVHGLHSRYAEEGGCLIGGGAATSLELQDNVGAEIPTVMLIAVAVVALVLLITSHAWLEPLVIFIVLAVSIVINMGTNFIFPDVSFITFAVSAILQLALSIDYAIMLLHSYNTISDEGMGPVEAMTEALARCFMRIASSALTTVAGLLSLLFMSFTIGFDIGLVLSKGIFISMLGVFLLMPSVTLIFGGALKRTRHRPIQLGGEHLARAVYRLRVPVAVVLTLVVAVAAVLQSGNAYSFTDAGKGSQGGESRRVSALFGESNPLALLVPGGDEDEDYDRQRRLAEALENVFCDDMKAVKGITAMVTTGAQALEYYTAADVARLTGQNEFLVRLFFLAQGFGDGVRADRLLAAAGDLAEGNEEIAALRDTLAAAQSAFNGPHYARMLIELSFPMSDNGHIQEAIGQIQEAARAVYGEDFYITGMPMSSYDIGNAFHRDLLKVNLITFAAILLIVALSFRSVILPVTLVFVIEGAIWITMGISRLMNAPIFFMSYLICVSIQMGATIDYGILLSDQYRALRREGTPLRQALGLALHRSMPTILTSGVILITAGFIIGRVSSVYYISDIGLLLSRGALISVILILTLLPALLSLFDGKILRAGSDE